MTKLKAIILAAGRGKRLGGDAPKVMQSAGGSPLLTHVLDALDFVPRDDIIIVVGYKKDDVITAFPDFDFAEQTEQLGTGHAALSAEPKLRGYDGAVLVCCGDMPLLTRETYTALVERHFADGNDCTVLSGVADKPFGFGRIARAAGGNFAAIVEEKDCTPEERAITEINAGVYVFGARAMLGALRGLSNENAQGEYYLTDAPALILKSGGKVGVLKRDLGDEIIGVNTPEQLAQVEAILKSRG
ncbi:MAG: NTP transferase domain-containing protein [Oscillospiraceae bacterium]|jgi:UDP-N-acetylglucosamine diphosphorylase/glucosamine-1-phosphate N-acetyltransferase|nr:NTP transferase domain-containing protein [Oscillospiraceae bacterium]